jgi:hypothetical protein
MKFYTAALLLAIAYAQDNTEAENTETTEETTEETVEEPKIFGGAIEWAESGTSGEGGSFAATVTYQEDVDGVMQIESSVDGTWGQQWKDQNANPWKKYWGGAMIIFAQTTSKENEAGETVDTTVQEGWFVGGQRDSQGTNAGSLEIAFSQLTLVEGADQTWNWVGAPPASDAEQTTAWTNGTGA